MIDENLPSYLRDAEKASARGQRSYLRLTYLGLFAAVVASIGGGISTTTVAGNQRIDLGGGISGLSFLVSIFLSYYLINTKPEGEWYLGRAAAESIKTLAWKYSVGGGAFGVDLNPNPDQTFVQRLREIDSSVRNTDLVLTATGSQVTDAMRSLRSASLPERMSRYLTDRIENESNWYIQKAQYNRSRAQIWSSVAITSQAIGLVFATLKTFSVVDIGLLGIAATVAASASAWIQTKGYQNLSQSYSVTARDLSFVTTEANSHLRQPEEERWRLFVEDAEQAISREHTIWLARRGAR